MSEETNQTQMTWSELPLVVPKDAVLFPEVTTQLTRIDVSRASLERAVAEGNPVLFASRRDSGDHPTADANRRLASQPRAGCRRGCDRESGPVRESARFWRGCSEPRRHVPRRGDRDREGDVSVSGWQRPPARTRPEPRPHQAAMERGRADAGRRQRIPRGCDRSPRRNCADQIPVSPVPANGGTGAQAE